MRPSIIVSERAPEDGLAVAHLIIRGDPGSAVYGSDLVRVLCDAVETVVEAKPVEVHFRKGQAAGRAGQPPLEWPGISEAWGAIYDRIGEDSGNRDEALWVLWETQGHPAFTRSSVRALLADPDWSPGYREMLRRHREIHELRQATFSCEVRYQGTEDGHLEYAADLLAVPELVRTAVAQFLDRVALEYGEGIEVTDRRGEDRAT